MRKIVDSELNLIIVFRESRRRAHDTGIADQRVETLGFGLLGKKGVDCVIDGRE
jgi:hypothetical protein